MDPSFASTSSFYSQQQDTRQQPVPGIHVSSNDETLLEGLSSPTFLPLPSQSFEALFPADPSLPWTFPSPSGLAVPYAGSSNGSSEAGSTSEAELFANLMAATSPSTSASPMAASPVEKAFLPDERVFYVPIDDGHGGQRLAAIDWEDFRGFLSNRPVSESGDLSKAARMIALCKPLETTFSGVTPPVQGSDLLPSPTGSSSPGHGPSKKLSPSNSGRGKHHRGPRIRSLSEQWLRACPIEIETPNDPLAVWWDFNLSRACVPELGKPVPTDEGRWIIFPAHEWYRVFLIEANTNKRTEVFPWSSKEGSNFWIRGQAMGLKECPCGEFAFFTHSRPDKDPFKRPSVLRKHFGECPKRAEDHPLRLLSQLQAGANTRARFHRASASGSNLNLQPLTPTTTSGSLVPPFTATTTSSSLIAPLVASGHPLFSIPASQA